ncbi:MAG: ABC transporter permease subunit [Clostridia bacterium]|nr:ABC transporter permease subunit [Clostridia bacterium]
MPSITDTPLILLVSLYLLTPILLTFFYSIFLEWRDVLPRGLTGKFYLVFFTDPIFWAAVTRTIVISLVPTLLCLIIVVLALYVVTVHHPKLDKILQIVTTIPYALQGVIIAISILSLYANAPQPFSNRILMLTGTYTIIILPYMYRGIRNNLQALNATVLIEAAQMLGSSKFHAFFAIIVPNLSSGILISALLSVAIIFGDFVVVNIIGGSYFETAQIYILRVMYQSGQTFCAISIVLFMATLLIALAVHHISSIHVQPKEKES